MPTRLIILGTGGNAGDIRDILESLAGDWDLAGFLDDARAAGSRHDGVPVLGRLDEAPRFPDAAFVNAIGSPGSYARRPRIIASTGLAAQRFATLVHAGASVSSRAVLGCGICVNAGASIASRVVIGDHAIVGPGAVIGHDTIVEDYAMIAPGAVVSGGVRLGRACYVGAGSAIRQEVRVGAGALVGIGAVVLSDVEDDTTVVGNPARPLVGARPAPIGADPRLVGALA